MTPEQVTAITGTADLAAQRNAALRMHEVQYARATRLEAERDAAVAKLDAIRALPRRANFVDGAYLDLQDVLAILDGETP
jgi:hypothetical protein